jgi:hypothetical protein
LISDLHKVHRVLRGDRWFEAAGHCEAEGIKPKRAPPLNTPLNRGTNRSSLTPDTGLCRIGPA